MAPPGSQSPRSAPVPFPLPSRFPNQFCSPSFSNVDDPFTESTPQPTRIGPRLRGGFEDLRGYSLLQSDQRPLHQIVRDHIWGQYFDFQIPISDETERENLTLIHIKPVYYHVLDSMAERLITQSNSRLTKANVVTLLTKEEAWSSLDQETKHELYDMLPRPLRGNNFALDPEVHPLKTGFAKYIKHFIYEWEQDLAAGRNTAKWEREAKQATGERMAGVYDGWKEKEREEHWGQKYDPEHFKAQQQPPARPEQGRIPVGVDESLLLASEHEMLDRMEERKKELLATYPASEGEQTLNKSA